MVENVIVDTVKRYLAVLPTVGIHARRGVLFGSFARGEADQDSDIDLIVIAPEFDEKREFDTIRKLWETTLLADSRIEPIPCGEQEWAGGDGRPILDVARREGIVIEAACEWPKTRVQIPFSRDAVRTFCQRHHICSLAVFGSVLREDFRPDSDIDVLVDFEEGAEPGLYELVGIQDELSAILGRQVDLVERKAVERSENYIRRRHILSTAETVYVAGDRGHAKSPGA
jgi:predicted nucleotidyltransferase